MLRQNQTTNNAKNKVSTKTIASTSSNKTEKLEVTVIPVDDEPYQKTILMPAGTTSKTDNALITNRHPTKLAAAISIIKGFVHAKGIPLETCIWQLCSS